MNSIEQCNCDNDWGSAYKFGYSKVRIYALATWVDMLTTGANGNCVCKAVSHLKATLPYAWLKLIPSSDVHCSHPSLYLDKQYLGCYTILCLVLHIKFHSNSITSLSIPLTQHFVPITVWVDQSVSTTGDRWLA